jgi:predicted AlkP superfamily pyrophosphatase or phosphodiesterase
LGKGRCGLFLYCLHKVFISYGPLNIDKFYTFYHAYDDESEYSTDVIGRETVKYINQNKPELLFVYLGQVDIMGHEHSGRSDQYANALIRIDYQIGKILDALTRAQILEETLVILTADHGHLKGINAHSTSLSPVPFYIMGPNIKKGEMKWKPIHSTNRIQNNLVAPLAAFFLGLDRPDEWETSVYRLLPYIYRP